MEPSLINKQNGRTLTATNRLVVKIGSALLVEERTGEIRHEWLNKLADDIANLKSRGKEVLIVSSGAIAVGSQHLGINQQILKLEEKQAAAATGQIRLAHAYETALARHSITVAQILLSPSDTEERRRHLNARATLTTLLRLGVIPVINFRINGTCSLYLELCVWRRYFLICVQLMWCLFFILSLVMHFLTATMTGSGISVVSLA